MRIHRHVPYGEQGLECPDVIEVPVGQHNGRRPRLDAEPLRGDVENLRSAYGQSRIDERPRGCGLLSPPGKVHVHEADPKTSEVGRQFLDGVFRLLSHGKDGCKFRSKRRRPTPDTRS